MQLREEGFGSELSSNSRLGSLRINWRKLALLKQEVTISKISFTHLKISF